MKDRQGRGTWRARAGGPGPTVRCVKAQDAGVRGGVHMAKGRGQHGKASLDWLRGLDSALQVLGGTAGVEKRGFSKESKPRPISER